MKVKFSKTQKGSACGRNGYFSAQGMSIYKDQNNQRLLIDVQSTHGAPAWVWIDLEDVPKVIIGMMQEVSK